MTDEQTKIPLGISSCLLGNPVRFDGSHKRDAFINDRLSDYFSYRPVCPEMAIGLGTPRPTLRLVGSSDTPRLVSSKDASIDMTQRMRDYAEQRAGQFGDLSGFILKKDSPSCGMQRVKVYDHNNMPKRDGVGLFARELMDANPLLPVEEEGRLKDPLLRENFIRAVFVYHRWRQMLAAGLSAKGLIDFHTRHKFIVRSQSYAAYQSLGKLLARLDANQPLALVAEEYIQVLMNVLREPAGRKAHSSVLENLAGFVSRGLERSDREELRDLIQGYRRWELPLIVPVTLLRHYARKQRQAYLQQQHYLWPHPDALGLLSNV